MTGSAGADSLEHAELLAEPGKGSGPLLEARTSAANTTPPYAQVVEL
ncbi:MAG: hypothetical protein GIX03_02270 [Candidatus Eremiobacteraeota bacterium]|nr:hypothetical protein [Candidatus Eremiobacteraeota bacterium]MBC5801843.1 hypothetical protein [Candidatus Eremiobacteraeota bacterium]MBC5822091.1 hypothetical protein [Candidatus Eremiobacteraeota bacterium]